MYTHGPHSRFVYMYMYMYSTCIYVDRQVMRFPANESYIVHVHVLYIHTLYIYMYMYLYMYTVYILYVMFNSTVQGLSGMTSSCIRI